MLIREVLWSDVFCLKDGACERANGSLICVNVEEFFFA